MAELIAPDEVLVVVPNDEGVEIRRRDARTQDAPEEDCIPNLTNLAVAFATERDWGQFHKPKDLGLSLMLEAAELLELMQWKDGAELDAHLAAEKDQLGDELADVLWYTLLLAHYQGVDLAEAFKRKLGKNASKYPVSRAKGSAAKYTRLVADE